MATSVIDDPVLMRFRDAMAARYGDRLERVVLFGSRARGDAKPDSDYDIAIFVRNPGSMLEESRALAEIETDILLDTGIVISALQFSAGEYADRTPLMREIRTDGRDL